MRALLSGMIAAFAFVAALHFRRFARSTGDRFFRLFAWAFALLAVNGIALGLVDPHEEGTLALYGIRLAAFVAIIVAIVLKNRS